MSDKPNRSKPVTPFRKAVIVSGMPYENTENDNEEEVEQNITIESGKGVWVRRYSYDQKEHSMRLIWKEKVSEDQEITEDILDAIAQEFEDDQNDNTVSSADWHLEVTDDDRKTHHWDGNFGSDDLEHLSEYIRDSLDDDSLFLFDGNPDRIERIEVTYRRNTKIPLPEDWNLPHITWDYHEQLILDRSSETIEYTRFIADETDISTKYHIAGGISDFLNDFEPDLFTSIEGNPSDVYEDPMESSTYTIAVITKNEGKREISGSFDRKGLPEDFPDFMDDLSAFLDFYGQGEMFDDMVYNHVRRRENELIFCNVEFTTNGQTYCYLADNDWYRPMDLVIVPTGEDNQETVARIVSIEYHTKDDAPYPTDRIKKIIRPFNDETDDHLVHTDL